MKTKPEIRLENIQGLRAIAALLVVSLHVFLVGQSYGNKPYMPVMTELMLPFGHMGVVIFFVISGFIIVWVSHRVAGDAAPFSRDSLRAASTFGLHRIARIYPLFWITLLASVIVRTENGDTGVFAEIWTRPEGVLLLSPPKAHDIAWTLVIEMHFYAIATVLILLAGRYVVRALTWWAVLHIAIVAGAMFAVGDPYSFFKPISMHLALGALLGAAKVRGLGHKAGAIGWLTFTVAVALALLADQWHYPGLLGVVVWAVPALGLVYGLITLETRYGLLFPAWIRRCGDWSYGIYLWHWPVLFGIGAAALALGRKGTMAGGWGYVATAVLLTLILAALTYRYFERPIMRWVQRWRPSTAPVAALVPAD